MAKIVLKILFIFLFLFVISNSVMAADLTVTCNASDCTPDSSPAIFPSTEIWYPGKTLTKTVNLANISGDPIDLNITNADTSTTGDLDQVMNLTIKRVLTGINVFDDTVGNFYGTSIDLPTLSNGTNEDYEFVAVMNSSAGNTYQSKETKFDLLFNFTVGTAPLSSSSDGGGGTVAGASAPVCSDQKPGSAPTLQSAVAGVNSVTLSWSQASSPVSYYLVTYGISPSNNAYGNTNVGGAGVTSYTVSGLSGGVTYCFLVRAGNGCAPGDFSNQICATPGGGFVSGPAAGFEAGVLGVATESAKLSGTATKTPGSVKGESTKVCKSCIWWQILVGELIALVLYYFMLVKGNITRRKYLVAFLIPVVAYIVFFLLNWSCGRSFIFIVSSSFFCKYFIIFDLVVYGLVSIGKKMRNAS